eukprot:COSAG05_NODE_10399_length_567_cov_1.098291_1_plen_47_part_10
MRPRVQYEDILGLGNLLLRERLNRPALAFTVARTRMLGLGLACKSNT